MTTFVEAVQSRRSYYALSNESTIDDKKLQAIVEDAVRFTPTSFNVQSGRAVVVLGDTHRHLWDTVYDAFVKTLGGDVKEETKTKVKFESAFKSGYGTIVFFEDQDPINKLAEKFPAFSQAFHVWSQNSAGILQYIVWTALETQGLGASLQHYGQVSADIEQAVQSSLGVPTTWISTALLPFGKPIGPPGGSAAKTFQPIQDRVRVLK